MVADAKRLGRALYALRTQHQLSQEELAAKAGLVASYISRFENGQYANPAYRTLDALAQAFDLPDAGVLMRRLELVDRSSRAADREVDRIRQLAEQLARELLAVPDTDREAAVQDAVSLVRSSAKGHKGSNGRRAATVR